jgi:uncharacterized protein
MRLLVDTNVVISGLLSRNSVPGQLMQLWRDRQCQWLTCEQQLEELTRVIQYPFIIGKVEGSYGSAYTFMMEFQAKTSRVELEPPFEPVCRDSTDDYLIAMLTRFPVDFLITGDKDLLSLKSAYPRILTPRELIDRL